MTLVNIQLGDTWTPPVELSLCLRVGHNTRSQEVSEEC